MKSEVDGMNKEALFLLGFFKGMGKKLPLSAVYFTVEYHGGRLRDDKKSKYFEHPIRVCRMLLSHGVKDDVILAAALLHDLVEDGHTTLDLIRKRFGEEVVYVVDLLTKKDGMTSDEYYRRLEVDARAIIIKAFDRVCNVDDMVGVFSVERLARYINDTKVYVLPMMKRARREYLEYTDILIICRDYIKGILRIAEMFVSLSRENDRSNAKIAVLEAKTKKYRAAEKTAKGSVKTRAEKPKKKT